MLFSTTQAYDAWEFKKIDDIVGCRLRNGSVGVSMPTTQFTIRGYI